MHGEINLDRQTHATFVAARGLFARTGFLDCAVAYFVDVHVSSHKGDVNIYEEETKCILLH